MKKRYIILLAFLLLTAGCVEVETPQECPQCECPTTCPELEVYFCPDGPCEDIIIDHIESADEQIYLAMYSLTNDRIGEALVAVAERGVDIYVLLEAGQISQYSEAYKLVEAGVPVREDTSSGYMHNKFMVIDNKTVLTGSVNYSANGVERNQENLLVIRGDYELVDLYQFRFEGLYEEGLEWVG